VNKNPNIENLKPFKKGESGNPNGRPKGKRSRSTIVKEWLEVSQKVKNPISGITEELEQQDIMTLALIKKAREGDVQAYRELMDSSYGKIESKIEYSGEMQAHINNFNIKDIYKVEET